MNGSKSVKKYSDVLVSGLICRMDLPLSHPPIWQKFPASSEKSKIDMWAYMYYVPFVAPLQTPSVCNSTWYHRSALYWYISAHRAGYHDTTVACELDVQFSKAMYEYIFQ